MGHDGHSGKKTRGVVALVARRFAQILIGSLLLLIGGVFAGVIFLRTDMGLIWLAETIQSVASDDGVTLRIGSIEGKFPEELIIRDVTVSDPVGTPITIDLAGLRWHPRELLQRRLRISELSIGTVVVDRGLVVSEEPEPAVDDGELSIPSLPIDVIIESASLTALELDEAIAGEPVRLSADASLRVRRSRAGDIALEIQRLDGVPAGLALSASFDPSRNAVMVDLDAHEPAGGLVATLLDLEGRPPVSAVVRGGGPLSDWSGTIDIVAEGLTAFTSDIRLAGVSPVDISVTGRADVEKLLPLETKQLFAGGIDVNISATVAPELITLRELVASAPIGVLRATGEFTPETEVVSANASFQAGPAELFDAFAPGLRYAAATAELTTEGVLPIPESALKVDLDGLSVDEAHIDATDLKIIVSADPSVTVENGLPAFRAQANLGLSGIETASAEFNELLNGAASLAIDGRIDPEATLAEVASLTLEAGPIGIDGTADLSYGEKPAIDAVIGLRKTDLSRFSQLAGMALQGEVGLDLTIKGETSEGIVASLTGGIDKLSTDIDAIGAAIGERLTVEATAQHDLDGGATIDAKVVGEALELVADGAVSADFAEVVRANLTLAAPDISFLNPLVGTPVAGALTANMTASGPADALSAQLTVDGRGLNTNDIRIHQIKVAVDADQIPARPSGTLEIQADTSLGPLEAETPFVIEDMARAVVDGILIVYDRAVTVTADLDVPFDGSPVVGGINLVADDLAQVGRRFEMEIDGTLTADIDLDAQNQLQTVTASISGDTLRYGNSGAPTANLAALKADIVMIDPAAQRQVDLTATIEDLSVGDGRVDQVMLKVDGVGESFDVAADAVGDLSGLTRAEMAAQVQIGDLTQVDLKTFEADLGGELLKLLRPAQFRAEADRMSVDGLALAFGEARADLSLQKSAASVDGTVAVSKFNLELIEKFAPGMALAGTLDVIATLTGTTAAPNVSIEAQANNVGIAQGGGQNEIAAKLAGDLNATIANDRADAQLTVTGLGDEPLAAMMTVPARFAVEPFVFEIDENKEMQGAIAWRGQLARLMQFVPIDTLSLTGMTAIDVSVAGTPAQPVLVGDIELTDGSLEIFESGTILKPLDLQAELTKRTIRLTSLEAGDAGDGTLQGSGLVGLQEPRQIKVDLDIDEATLVRRDDVTSSLSGNVRVDGTIGRRVDVVARIENEFTEIRLVDRLPPSIDTIDVVYAQEVKNNAVTDAPTTDESDTLASVFLDVTVDMPRQVFVRGRGLESEWAGRFDATGSADQPRVSGSLQPLRGEFELLGRLFIIDEGEIVLDGLDQDPLINLTASHVRSDFAARVVASGTPSEPKIELTSVPELPQDEILARLLFGKSSGTLTAAEAAQLAAALAALSSGEPGVIDKVRDAAGLDRLRFEAASEEDEDEFGTVEAGRYVAEGVYVGGKQGATPETTEAIVEIDITDSISAKSATTSEGRNRVGVFWEWKY
jgi:translocation and assembly module TamB